MRNCVAFIVAALVLFSLALVMTQVVNMYAPHEVRVPLAVLEGWPIWWLSVLIRRGIARDPEE